MKIAKFCLLVIMMMALTACSAGAENVIQVNGELPARSAEEVFQMLEEATNDYLQDQELAEELQGEISREDLNDPDEGEYTVYTLNHGGYAMRFLMEQKGEPDGEGRYPLYITLHGGGESDPESNDSQWFGMFGYYKDAVENGIYIACRGITDTWDLHFQPASYPLYDRLIQAMILLYNADPNRVYLMGFSAGGDGVYQIAARMTDRFAAANMSSGHPNGISLRNLMNCPFSIQVGVRDYYTESAMRCIRGAEFDQVLSDYHDLMDYGYEHQVLVRVPNGHNYDDYDDPSGLADEYQDQLKSSVLENPSAYADPEIVEPMLNRFLEAYQTTAVLGEDFLGEDMMEQLRESAREAVVAELGYEAPEAVEQMLQMMMQQNGGNQASSPDIMEMSYFSAEVSPAFDDAVRSILTDEFGLNIIQVNGSAVWYVSQFTRNPAPPVVVWDLETRAPEREVTSFYWLKADPSVDQGTIQAMVGDGNTITVTAEDVNGDFSILINPLLIDVSQPVHFVTPDGDFDVQVNPSEDTLRESMRETGDPSMAWVAEIPYSLLLGGQ